VNSNINKENCRKKGLVVNEDYTFYKSLRSYYKFLFEKYIMTKINLKKYDDIIESNDFNYGIPDMRKVKEIQGVTDYLNLKYIVILNNLYIEKLSVDDINTLKKYYNLRELNLNEEINNLIERTYKLLIRDNYFRGNYIDDVYQVSYSPIGYDDIPEYAADNDSLVVKFYYVKGPKKYEGDNYLGYLKRRRENIREITKGIVDDFRECLDVKCEVMYEEM